MGPERTYGAGEGGVLFGEGVYGVRGGIMGPLEDLWGGGGPMGLGGGCHYGAGRGRGLADAGGFRADGKRCPLHPETHYKVCTGWGGGLRVSPHPENPPSPPPQRSLPPS